MTKLKNLDYELSSPTRSQDTFPIVGNGKKKLLYFFSHGDVCCASCGFSCRYGGGGGDGGYDGVIL